MIGTMVVSGAISGLAGTATILFRRRSCWARTFRHHRGGATSASRSRCWADSRPLPIIVAALFFGALQAGAEGMQLSTGTPASIAGIIEALTIILVLGGSVARLALIRRARLAATRRASAEQGAPVDMVEDLPAVAAPPLAPRQGRARWAPSSPPHSLRRPSV